MIHLFKHATPYLYNRMRTATTLTVFFLMATLASSAAIDAQFLELRNLVLHSRQANNALLSRSKKEKKTSDSSADNTNTVYDSYVLATEWSGAVCRVKNCNSGRPRVDDYFNLHGLWPNSYEDFRNSPFECDKTPIDLKKLPADVQLTQATYWNALYNSDQTFLNHEWTKHGSCWMPAPKDSSKVPGELKSVIEDSLVASQRNDIISKQSHYIKASVAVAQHFNIYDALAAKGIYPSNSKKHVREELVAAITDYFGIDQIEILCSKDQRTGESLLLEVRLCLDMNYNVQRCHRHNIQCAKEVVYPEYD